MLPIRIGRYEWVALPQRALYWPAQQMLLLADLHLGKADTFRHFGVGIPHTLQESDLARLSHLLDTLAVQRCVVLGDFVHGRIVAPATCALWNALVDARSHIRFELVLGNHDRAFDGQQLHIESVQGDLRIDGICLSHEPVPASALGDALNIHGHIHPAVRLPGMRQKLPAFVYEAPYLNLPAFSEFTAGVQPARARQSIWVVHEDEGLVLQIQ